MTDADREMFHHLFNSVSEMQSLLLQVHKLVADHKAETQADVVKVSGRLEALIQAHAAFVNATEERVDDHSARMDANALEAISRIEQIEKSAAWVRAWSAGAAAVLVAMFGAVVWVGARLPSVIDVLANGGK